MSTDFSENSEYEISRKSVRWELRRVIVIFRKCFANTPKDGTPLNVDLSPTI